MCLCILIALCKNIRTASQFSRDYILLRIIPNFDGINCFTADTGNVLTSKTH